MSNNYLCPRCKSFLNVGEHLVFNIKTKKPRGGLIFLSPEIGNYQVIKHPHFELEEGELVDFLCPICHRKIHCTRNPYFARIVMIDSDYNEFEIVFSRKVGEKCSFKVKEGKITEYGKHASRFNDMFKSLQSNQPFKNL